MKASIRVIAAAFVFSQFAAGCVSHLAPTAPPAAAPLRAVEPISAQSSYLALIVPVDFADLNRLINERVPSDFAALQNISLRNGITASFTLGRQGDIQVLALEGRLQVIVPLRLDVEATWSTSFFGRRVGHTERATLTAAVRIDTRINADSDWNATSESDVALNMGSAIVNLGPARLNLRDIVQSQLEPYVGQIGQLVDETIGETLNLRTRMEALWPQMMRPVQLSEDPSVWIRIEPEEVQWVRPRIDGSAFTFGLGVRARVRSYLGPEPQVEGLPELPALTEVQELQNEFHLYVPIELPFSDLTAVARTRLVGTDRVLDSGATLHIESIDITGGEDGRVHIALGITARQGILRSAHGTLHMLGTPVYDPETRIVSCENVEYDLDTRNVLLRTASYAMHDDFLAGVQEALTFEAGEQIDAAIAATNQDAARIEVSPQLALRVSVDSVDIGTIRVSDHAMVIVGEAHGSVNADVSLFGRPLPNPGQAVEDAAATETDTTAQPSDGTAGGDTPRDGPMVEAR